MEFATSHFIGIIAIIVIVVKTIGEYYKTKSDKVRIIDGSTPVDNFTSPRIQHYKFAHEVLNNMFFEDKDSLIKNVLSSEGELRGLWYDVGQYYSKEYEGAVELDGTDIKISAKEFEDTLFVVISLPTPEHRTEAYFVGLIIPLKKKDNSSYITLEYGDSGSVLCEWTQDSHLNFGEGPAPTLDNFQDKLIDMGNVSVNTWDDAKSVYSGEAWMNTLWEWADTHDISPLILPRNSKDLEALEILSLSFINLQIEYLPKEIGKLSNLETFVLQNSKLKELPNEFSNLVNLKYLYIDDNELATLPETFCNLTQLERVFLGSNQLTSLPSCIGNLKHLTVLSLYSNQLQELPLSLADLKLQELSLSGNPIEHIPKEIQDLLNSMNKEESLEQESFTILWQECGENSEYAKRFNVPNFDGHLPFFLSGEEVSKIGSEDGVLLTERHLFLGILYGLNIAGEGSVRLRVKDEKVLIDLLDILREGYGFETLEEMILDASARIRKINGSHPNQLILETGNKLVPNSSKIKSDLIMALWAEISDKEDNIELLEKIPVLVEEIDVKEIHVNAKEWVFYYGLCALIFIHRANNEDYHSSGLVDNYLKNYFYSNVTNKALLNNAVALMEKPDSFQPIDLRSPIV